MTRPIPGGLLVAIEGIDGAGKTTQVDLLAGTCFDNQLDCVVSKEPTSGPYGAAIRASGITGRLPLEAEVSLLLHDRRQHVSSVILPALERQQIVVLDRYYFSNAAYQGARGAKPEEILAINEHFAPQPDLLIVLDLPVDVGLSRVRARGDEPNKFERPDSLERARAIFNSIQRPYLHRIDAEAPIDFVHSQLIALFNVAAANKISQHECTPSAVNRIRQLFGERALPLPSPNHAMFSGLR